MLSRLKPNVLSLVYDKYADVLHCKLKKKTWWVRDNCTVDGGLLPTALLNCLLESTYKNYEWYRYITYIYTTGFYLDFF